MFRAWRLWFLNQRTFFSASKEANNSVILQVPVLDLGSSTTVLTLYCLFWDSPDALKSVEAFPYKLPFNYTGLYFITAGKAVGAEVKNDWLCNSTGPVRLHGVYGIKFTFLQFLFHTY